MASPMWSSIVLKKAFRSSPCKRVSDLLHQRIYLSTQCKKATHVMLEAIHKGQLSKNRCVECSGGLLFGVFLLLSIISIVQLGKSFGQSRVKFPVHMELNRADKQRARSGLNITKRKSTVTKGRAVS